MMSSSPSSQSLKAWLEPDETAVEFLNRVRLEALKTGVFFIDQELELRPGHVVEITGASGSCKTDILVQAAVTSIMPEQHKGCPLHGLERPVLYIDLDCKVDILRLLQILHAWTLERLTPDLCADMRTDSEIQEIINASLPRLHLARCTSSRQYLAVLGSASSLFAEWREAAGARALVLLLDGVSAHLAVDASVRGAAPSAASGRIVPAGAGLLAPGGKPRSAALGLHAVHAAAAAALRELAARRRVAVLAARWVRGDGLERGAGPPLFQLAQGREAPPGGQAAEERMPASWTRLVTHRLDLGLLPGGGYPQGATHWARWAAGVPAGTCRLFAVRDEGFRDMGEEQQLI